jgi:hypothetical protein
MTQEQTDNAAAIIIIIDDIEALCAAVKGTDLVNMRVDKQAEIQGFVASSRACAQLAADEAGVS